MDCVRFGTQAKWVKKGSEDEPNRVLSVLQK
jgi:hypothetical protein